MGLLARLFGSGPKAADRPDPGAVPSTVDSVAGIAASLDRLVRGPDTFVIFTSDVARNAYVQAVVTASGLTLEAVSSTYLKGSAGLSTADEATLRALGWILDGDGSANWSQDLPGWPGSGSSEAASLVAETLTNVYDWQPGQPIQVERGV